MAQFPGGVRRKVLLQLLLLLCHPYPVVSVCDQQPTLGFPGTCCCVFCSLVPVSLVPVSLVPVSWVLGRAATERALVQVGRCLTLPPETQQGGCGGGCPPLRGPSGLGSSSCRVTFTVLLGRGEGSALEG